MRLESQLQAKLTWAAGQAAPPDASGSQSQVRWLQTQSASRLLHADSCVAAVARDLCCSVNWHWSIEFAEPWRSWVALAARRAAASASRQGRAARAARPTRLCGPHSCAARLAQCAPSVVAAFVRVLFVFTIEVGRVI